MANGSTLSYPPRRSTVHPAVNPDDSPEPATGGFSPSLFHAIVEASPEILLVADANRHVLYANSAAAGFWGRAASELRSTPVDSLLPDLASILPSLEHSSESTANHAQQHAELSSGFSVPVEIRLSPLTPGFPFPLLIAVYDLRRHKLAEQRFQLVVESAPNAIVMTDASGTIVLVNRQTEKAFGYPRSELLGQPVEHLLPNRFRRRHTAFRDAYHHHPESRPMGAGRDLHGLRKDGVEFPVEVGLTPVETEEGLMTLAMIIDISERKHLEAERLRLEEQVLEVSENEQRRIGQDLHDDLCQQLASIACLARVAEQQLARRDPDHAPILEEIREMVTQANVRAREIAHGLVPAVLETEGLAAALHRLASQVEILYDVPCVFRCDNARACPGGRTAAHLYRIGQEAVANAVKHANPSQIDIVLQHDSGRLILEVNDDGTGLTPQTAAPKGLGLRTMNHRASLLGADLFISTRQPGGTSVICSVPLPGSATSGPAA